MILLKDQFQYVLAILFLLPSIVACDNQKEPTLYERALSELVNSAQRHARNPQDLHLDSFRTVYEDDEACVIDYSASSVDERGMPVSEQMEFVYYENGHRFIMTSYRQSERESVVSGYYSTQEVWTFAELQPVFERLKWIE